MAIDPTRVPRFGHGSRVPGWDEAADLTKDPEGVPDPATTPVPEDLRSTIEEYMARVAKRAWRETGIRVPSHDAELFVRASADAGLLRIVQ